jgi:hypothetical protein
MTVRRGERHTLAQTCVSGDWKHEGLPTPGPGRCYLCLPTNDSHPMWGQFTRPATTPYSGKIVW